MPDNYVAIATDLGAITGSLWFVGTEIGPRGGRTPNVWTRIGESILVVGRDRRLPGPDNWVAYCVAPSTKADWFASPRDALLALRARLARDRDNFVRQTDALLAAWPDAPSPAEAAR